MMEYFVFNNESAAGYKWYVAEFNSDYPNDVIDIDVAGRKGIIIAYFLNPEDADIFCETKKSQLNNGK